MVKLAGKTVVDMATDLITDQILQIAKKVIEKLIRQQVNNDVEIKKFYLEIATEECFAKEKGWCFAFVDLENTFSRVPRDAQRCSLVDVKETRWG